MLSYLEISKDSLLHNVRVFRSFINAQTKISFPIKGNAYGHGQNEIAQIVENKVDIFQVDDLQELKKLRAVSDKTSWVLGYVAIDELEEVIALNGIPVLYDLERARYLDNLGNKLQKKVPVNLKFDVFHGRQGVQIEKVDEFLMSLKEFNSIKVIGAGAHFSSADDPHDIEHTTKQIDTFRKIKEMLAKNGFTNIEYHVSNTAGVLEYEKNKGENTVVRVGIGMYGLWPSKEIQAKYESREISLKPVLRWVTHVAQVKTFPPGYSIGYNRTYITTKQATIALIPQGYSDGYDRGLSNQGEVLIRGKRCRITGRVATNMFMVDVSHVSGVKAEDEVVLLGNQGAEAITAEEIAEKINTINYEVVTRISPLLPRKIV
jgi:alanine racemase